MLANRSAGRVGQPDTDTDPGTDQTLALPPSVPPLEETLLARDETANLGWIIEMNTGDEDGDTVDRNQLSRFTCPS